MKRIIISALALIIIVAAAVSGYLWWSKQKADTTAGTETEITLGENSLGEIPETTESGESIEPIIPEDQGTESAPAEATVQVETNADETSAPIDLSTNETGPEAPDLTETTSRGLSPSAPDTQRETRPIETSETSSPQPTGETPEVTVEVEPVPTTPVIETSEPLGLAEATPTPTSTATPIPTAPAATPTPGPAPGNYSVTTTAPVMESQLAGIRQAMRSLGVQLQEQRTGQQQRLQAYRVALGFFRTKEEASSWARTNFRPKGIEYFVYPARGMYSIQVGVYRQQQNVERKMRDLHQKFPGWRLPLRSEPTNISSSMYHLSVRGIKESLARKVQDTLTRLRVQTELTGI